MAGTMSTAIHNILYINTAFEDPRPNDKGRLNKLVAEFLSTVGASRIVTSSYRMATAPGRPEFFEWNVLRTDLAKAFWEKLETVEWNDLAIRLLDDIYQQCLETGWDGYDAIPISQEAYLEARRLLKIIPSSFPMPDISPQPNGEVGLEWYKDRGFVFVITVGGRNEITYAGLFGNNNETHGMEFFSDSLPKAVSENIKRLFPPIEW